MLSARCFQNVKWLTCRRCIYLSRPSSTIWRKAWENVKGLVTETKNSFDEELISKAHKSDGINMDKWLLIYSDQATRTSPVPPPLTGNELIKNSGPCWCTLFLCKILININDTEVLGAIQSFLLVSVVFPIVLIGATVIVYDFYNNEHRNRLALVRRLSSDLEEIGIFAVIPGIALLMVTAILLRLHQMRLLRIYQDRMSGEKYIAIGSKNVVWKRQIPFDRNCASAIYFSSEQVDLIYLLLQILVGNIQVLHLFYIIWTSCQFAFTFVVFNLCKKGR